MRNLIITISEWLCSVGPLTGIGYKAVMIWHDMAWQYDIMLFILIGLPFDNISENVSENGARRSDKILRKIQTCIWISHLNFTHPFTFRKCAKVDLTVLTHKITLSCRQKSTRQFHTGCGCTVFLCKRRGLLQLEFSHYEIPKIYIVWNDVILVRDSTHYVASCEVIGDVSIITLFIVYRPSYIASCASFHAWPPNLAVVYAVKFRDMGMKM